MMATLAGLLEIFDVEPTGGHRYHGTSDAGQRDIIDGSQVLAQSIVAASKSLPAKSVRSARAAFFRPVRAGLPIEFTVDVLHDGRSFATVIVTAAQGERPCVTTTLMMDIPHEDVFRHPVVAPVSQPDEAIPYDMALAGRELRLVGVTDPNDPTEVGPPVLDAWVRYDAVPERRDLAAALLAHFTGHLSISTAMRPHAGFGTAMSHQSLSTGVLAISVSFHEPVAWTGWLRYFHESVHAGAGVAFARGLVQTEDGRPLASFTQDSLLRKFDPAGSELGKAERARL
jgi:acyl-CoA thioesterase II